MSNPAAAVPPCFDRSRLNLRQAALYSAWCCGIDPAALYAPTALRRYRRELLALMGVDIRQPFDRRRFIHAVR